MHRVQRKTNKGIFNVNLNNSNDNNHHQHHSCRHCYHHQHPGLSQDSEDFDCYLCRLAWTTELLVSANDNSGLRQIFNLAVPWQPEFYSGTGKRTFFSWLHEPTEHPLVQYIHHNRTGDINRSLSNPFESQGTSGLDIRTLLLQPQFFVIPPLLADCAWGTLWNRAWRTRCNLWWWNKCWVCKF